MLPKNLLVSLILLDLVLCVALNAVAQDLETGVDQYRAGAFAEAEKTLRAVIGTDAGNADAHLFLGLSLLELNKWDESESELNAAEGNSHPDLLKLGLARIHMERRQMEEALAELNEAQAANPDSADVYYYRGILRSNRKEHKLAAQDLEKALELDPQKAYAHYYAGLAYNGLGKQDKMAEHFEMFLKMAPKSSEAQKVRSLLRAVQ